MNPNVIRTSYIGIELNGYRSKNGRRMKANITVHMTVIEDWWTGLVDWTARLVIFTLSNETHTPIG